MLVMNLFNDQVVEEDLASDEPEYPDEVLESEWNPVLAEIQSTISSDNDGADTKKDEQIESKS
ncbi:MAG: hypothetical protein KZQ93_18740 [Candidatus Thiodiazotropha sp. (ex Monitilora ramsayi)]|nr:hypothetical protein [Candidatus Thiodiazotropha sp. (ex Monitilora ramsayi)]